ncbi:ATP-dependent 6-phosphofructokinase isozyme 2 [Defluviimonas aquaemixtae]|uniref:Phosphofructokinase n=1 Tax=Albidovulum aquaemixtae TaxID=1542388 RepID=A0A2R8B2I1_9RHOB|nr:1-phosphofructokinase family hexose kinase [Defluviimonas aquaemixtae]SPH16787.1 ATP-dependent 6-phosphofructokinase isozyme 2 [Defluviimonas aquaemixtae]
MTPILTVTLNPALDLATSTERVRPGPKLRCDVPRIDPGGGGINVSRVIARLGGDSLAFVALGGATGKRLAHALAREGVRTRTHAAPGETRESLSVTDRETGGQYRFVLPGSTWSEAEGAAAISAVVDAASTDSLVVMSGSLPPGLSHDAPARLSRALAPNGGRLILDTSGPTLDQAARPEAPVHVLRMDEAEAEVLAGTPLKSRRDSADFAQSLVRQGAARIVIVARGADGSVLATAGKRLFARAAEVPVSSKVGAGDSFVAAFTLALALDRPLDRALQEAMAAASAAVMTEATELCRPGDVKRLVEFCTVTQV